MAHSGANRARFLRGSNSFRAELARYYFDSTGGAASGGALTDAVNVLEGMALQADREPLHLRVARHGGAIVVNLAREDGRVVVVGPGAWAVALRSPVPFRHTRAMSAMPLPAEAGSLNTLKDLLNIRDESWPLILGWLVCALMPGLAVPILLFLGEQGSAKSTAGRLVSGLLDPSPAPLRRAPTDVRDWVAQASASHVVVLDNITEIKPWFQDCLCRAVTGEGSVDRPCSPTWT